MCSPLQTLWANIFQKARTGRCPLSRNGNLCFFVRAFIVVFNYSAQNLTLSLVRRLSACLSLCLMGCVGEQDIKAAPAPMGVVSTSLCGDAYLQAFTPEHILALSWQSRSELSMANDAQKKLPQIDSQAERVLPHKEALILFGVGEGRTLKDHLPFTDTLEWTEGFEGVSKNADSILQKLSLPRSGLESWESRVSDLIEKGDALRAARITPKILYLSRAGGSAGPKTFIDAVIHAAGGENINPVAGWHSPELETLLNYQPDIILRSFSGGNYHSRSDITNPALSAFIAKTSVIDIKGGYWPCAGPGLLDAAEILQTEILTWIEKPDA